MKHLTLQATDGFSLAATLFQGSSQRIIIINSATGVPRKIYSRFAQHLTSLGATVVTYDYRGIGESKKTHLKNEKATMSDWALKDAQSVLNYCLKEFPEHKISVVGHSFGGQCLGLLENIEKVDKMLFIGAQLGYWKNFPSKDWPKLLAIWYGLLPAFCKTLGYFPSKKLGMGEDLPRGVAMEWRDWCCHPDYLFKDIGKKFSSHYEKITSEMTILMASDDFFAPELAIRKLLERYPNGKKKFISLNPKDLNVKEIGHFGLFRDNFKTSLWKDMAAALL